MHRATIGCSRGMRGPDGMEMGIAIVIIATVMVMAAWFGMRLVPMTQALDAVSLASGPKSNAIVYYAVHGRWPAPGDPHMIGADGKSRYARNFTLDGGGVMTADLVLDPFSALHPLAGMGVAPGAGADTIRGSLSFRPELLGARDAPTIVFLCGYAKPLMGGAATSGVNRTTLDSKFLPPFCR